MRAGVERITLGALLGSEERLAALAAELAAGAVAAVPTETFYGLAADPSSAEGVARVLAAKGEGRAGKPLLVLVADGARLGALPVDPAPGVLDRFRALWPAPLTVVLPLTAPIAASLGQPSLAVRVPAHAGLRALLGRVGPLTGTSANRSGQPPCSDPDAVERQLGEAIDVLVDGGETPGGEPSTLIDATVDPPRLLRAGAFPWPPERR